MKRFQPLLAILSAIALLLITSTPVEAIQFGGGFSGSSGKARATLFSRVEGERVDVAIRIDINPGWHLYHSELGHPEAIGKPTKIELTGEGVEWGELEFPKPHRVEQPDWDAFILAHEGTIVIRASGVLTEGAGGEDIGAILEGLTCEDDGLCVPYGETIETRGAGADELFAASNERSAERPGHEKAGDAEQTPTLGSSEEKGPADGSDTNVADGSDAKAAEGSGDQEAEQDDLWAFLGLAVFWGLFTLLMPCTYPMIPITISFFTKQAADRKGSALPLSMAYGFGIVAIFVLIGVGFGSVIIPFATHPVTNLVIGALFLYFALVLFGVVNLQPPRFMLEFAGKASRTGGYLGVFLMGATLVVTSFTCTAPFVGSLLSFGAQGGDVGRIALGMAVFGMTMALPFVALSLVPGYMQNIPRSGEWMNTLKVFLGFIELAAAFKFISNTDLVWGWELFSRELFLAIWVVIFIACAVFLFGFLPGKRAKPGILRAFAGLAMLVMSGYSAWGMSGRDLDSVMTAIVPNYSGGLLMPEWRDFGSEAIIVVDDYDSAVQRARTEKRMLLVNFTGHT